VPRDALRHGKWQNLKRSRDYNHAHLGVIYHYYPFNNTTYVEKFDDSSFSYSSDMIGGLEILTGSRDVATPISVTFCHVALVRI